MKTRLVAILIASLASVLAACDGGYYGFRSLTAPAMVGPQAPFGGPGLFDGASLLPSTIGFTSIRAFACPALSPFASTFSLFVDARDDADLFVDGVVFVFVDRLGHRSPLLEFTPADLSRMFGTTFVAAGGTRTFPFTAQFGCGFQSVPSQLVVDVSILNRSGVRRGSAITASFR